MTAAEQSSHPKRKRRSSELSLVASGRFHLPLAILPWERELVVGALRTISQESEKASGNSTSREGPRVKG